VGTIDRIAALGCTTPLEKRRFIRGCVDDARDLDYTPEMSQDAFFATCIDGLTGTGLDEDDQITSTRGFVSALQDASRL